AMLVVAPLMHGNAQWVMWNAFMMAGTAVLYTDNRNDPQAVLRLAGDEGVLTIALVGDAMARPLAEALESAPPGAYDTSTLMAIASGGAMLSATVKAELKEQLPGIIIMDRFGSSESGAQGAVEDDASGPRFVMSDDTSVLDDELRPLTPGDGRIGHLARTGRIPPGYYQGPGQDRCHLSDRCPRRPVVGARRPGIRRARRHHHCPRSGLGFDQLRWGE